MNLFGTIYFVESQVMRVKKPISCTIPSGNTICGMIVYSPPPFSGQYTRLYRSSSTLLLPPELVPLVLLPSSDGVKSLLRTRLDFLALTLAQS